MADLLWYGGLAGMAVSLLVLIILLPVFRKKRKSLYKQIEEGEL